MPKYEELTLKIEKELEDSKKLYADIDKLGEKVHESDEILKEKQSKIPHIFIISHALTLSLNFLLFIHFTLLF